MNRQNWIWISWERHRRTEDIVRDMQVEAYIFDLHMPRWRKHPTLLACMARLLARRRPAVLFVQNPSWFLTALAITLKPLLGYKPVVDAHNADTRKERRP